MAEHVVTFRQGAGGYLGTVDTQLSQAAPTQSYGSTAVLGVDKGTDVQVLLRFDDIFGSLAGQIPAGATIVSATLGLQTTNAGNGAALHRMLTNWSGTSTWNSLVNGVQANGVEAAAAATVVTGATNTGQSQFDVTSSVQAWLAGAANLGWVFLSQGTNGWDFYSAQGATPPLLTVRYSTPDGPANTLPIAATDTATVNEDGSVQVNVLANDSDADGHTLTVTGAGAPAHGSVLVNANGTITYTPTANYHGTDSFQYTVSDGNGGTATGTVNVTVSPINDAPVAAADTAQTPLNTPVTIAVLANDSDVDANPLTVTGVGTPAHGTTVLNSNGTVTYTPATGYSGSDTFTYAISDGQGGVSSASVTVQVAPATPTWVEHQLTFKQGVNGYSGTVDTQLIQANPTLSSANATTLMVDKSTDVQVLLRFDGLFGNLASQIPAGAEILSATLSLYTTNTGNGATLHRMLTSWSDTSTWASLVNGVQANNVEARTISELSTGATSLGLSSYNVTASVQAWLAGASNLGWVFISQGTNGWDFYSAQGSVPPQLTITYRVPGVANTPPIAVTDAISLAEDGSTVIAVLANDTDANNDSLSLTGVGSPTHGVATLNGNGTITYTPFANYYGSDSFTYAISDGHGGTATGTVNVTVTPLNDAPVANPDATVLDQDTSVIVAVLTNDTDIDGDTLAVSGITTQGAHGTATINGNGTITYTPVAGYYGTDSFTYAISDGHGGTATSTVQLTINQVIPANTPPVAATDTVTLAEDATITIAVLGNDTDADGNPLTVTGLGSAAHGVVTLNPDNTVTYTPAANYYGPDSFTYAISDGQGGTATGTVNITVTPLNDAPIANPDTFGTSQNTATVLALLANDTDIEGNPLTVTNVGSPAHGVVVINTDGTVTYTPAANFHGTDSFSYTISDGQGGTASSTATITVAPPSGSAPLADADVATLPLNGALAIRVLANDSDPDGDSLSVTGIATGPSHGNVVVNPDNTITYTPTTGFTGYDTFVYAISDGNGGNAVGSVSVYVDGTAQTASYVATSLTSGATRNLEHGNASKSFYAEGTWWAILPDGGNWSIHRYSGSTPPTGQTGGWTIASPLLFSNSNRSELAWDAVHEKLYVLQYSSSNSEPHLFQLAFNDATQQWQVDVNVNLNTVLSGSEWTRNAELGIGLDQNGMPILTAIAASTQGTQGLHVAYATSTDLSSWGTALLDPTTRGLGGSNGNSKADIITFTQDGHERIGIFYSRDGSGTDDDWSFAWHNTSGDTTTYGNGWNVEQVTDTVNIDNHMSAVSDGEFIYALIKDDNDAIWLLKGRPGAWDAPYLVVDGDSHNPSRPTVVLDETNDQIYIFYQEDTHNPEGQIYMKVFDTHNPVFDPTSLGEMIMQGNVASHDFFDPQSPAHAVGADTGGYFLLLAKNEALNQVWYNDIHLGSDHLIA